MTAILMVFVLVATSPVLAGIANLGLYDETTYEDIEMVNYAIAVPFADIGAKPLSARTGGLFNLNPTIEEARDGLNHILAYAKAIDLTAYPDESAAQTAHAISRAMGLCDSAAAADVNIARLRLQVAVDTLKVDLQRVNVDQLQSMVRAGELTYVELMRMYLTRIEMYDFNTISINSILALNPNAFEIAAAKDAMVALDPSLATGIFGMTVLVKDNIGTVGTDGMATTAGSVALRYNYAPFDATVITGIKEAGGIIFGKVNLAEFANWTANGALAANAPARAFYQNRFGVPYPHPGNAPNGHSSLGGQVLNPYNVDISPQGWPVFSASGSSTGSGSAAAAALSAVTIGSETSGSILDPARATSTVGIKPTVGLLSRYGVIPLAAAYDTTGPMTRNVHDAAVLLTAMARFDPNDVIDNYHTSPDFTLDYTDFLNPNALYGKRLGVVGGAATMNNTPEGIRAREILESLGATIVTGVTVTGGVQVSVLNYEFNRDLNNYLARMTDPRLQVRTVLDIIDYYHNNPSTTPVWGFHNLINAHIDNQTLEQYETTRNNSIMNARNSIDNALRTHNLDALISFAGLSGVGAAAGYPSVNVPIGYNVGAAIPANNRHWNPFFSINFTGTAFSEASLIAMAYAFEQASMVRIPPGMAARDGLRGLINQVDAMDEAVRLPALDALNNARAVANSNFSTQKDVDLAYERLKAAISTPINEVGINVTVPIGGAMPEATAFGEGRFTIGSVLWTPKHSPFQAGTTYTATVALTANEGYTFFGISDVKINGALANIVGTPGTTITISQEFTTWAVPYVFSTTPDDFISIWETARNSRQWNISFWVTETHENGEYNRFMADFTVAGANANLRGHYVFGENHLLEGHILVYDIRNNGNNVVAFDLR